MPQLARLQAGVRQRGAEGAGLRDLVATNRRTERGAAAQATLAAVLVTVT